MQQTPGQQLIIDEEPRKKKVEITTWLKTKKAFCSALRKILKEKNNINYTKIKNKPKNQNISVQFVI